MSGKHLLLYLFFAITVAGYSQPPYFEWGYKLVYDDPALASATKVGQIKLDKNNNLKVISYNSTNSKIATYSPRFELLSEILLPKKASKFELTTNNEIIIYGIMESTTDFDMSSSVFEMSPSYFGDHFLASYDETGNFLWAKQFHVHNHYDLSITNILLDDQNNIFIGGNFYDTLDFDLGSGVHEIGSYGARDMFIMKLNETGDLIWMNHYGTSETPITTGPDWDNDERLMSMRMDQNGNLLITGNLSEQIDFDPAGSTPVLSEDPNGQDFFIARINTGGSLIWFKTLDFFGSLHLFASDAVADKSDNVLITFDQYGDLDIDPGPQFLNMPAYSNLSDCYLLKLDANGNYMWAKHFGKSMESHGYHIETDQEENIYLLGGYRHKISFENDSIILTSDLPENPNYYWEQDHFIGRFDASGNLEWLRSISGKSNETIHMFVMDETGNIYLPGAFSGTVNLNPKSSDDILTSQGLQPWHNNSFIMKYGAPAGNPEEQLGWLYPNPNDGNFFVEIYSSCSIKIFTMTGSLVLQNSNVSPDKYEVNLPDLESGVYILQLTNDESSESIQFVVTD